MKSRAEVRSVQLFAILGWAFLATQASGGTVRAGIATRDITPKVDGSRPVYIAGYGQNRKATGVHDPLFVRAAVLESGGTKVALASVDLVGLQYPVIERIRSKLDGFAYVLVASTHSHEGPDVIGLWGPGIRESGVDPEYLAMVEERVVDAIRAAEESMAPVKGYFGVARDKSLLRDSRPPEVYDDFVRVLVLKGQGGKPAGLLVVGGCHPEALGSQNTLLTADFPWATIQALEKAHGCKVVYFSGAVGGLMTTPRSIQGPGGKELREGNFEYAEVYGKRLAAVAEKAIASAEPIDLAPIKVGAKVCALPLENPTYHLLWFMGVLNRSAYKWLGDPFQFGEVAKGTDKGRAALKTEVCFLQLGDLDVVGIPGELYPEILFGKYQEPVEPNADFPDAPLEPAIADLTKGRRLFFIGLANDEVGYIIPKRQWDWKPPYCYGRSERLYGEINSIGSSAAPILIEALIEAMKAAGRDVPESAAHAR